MTVDPGDDPTLAAVLKVSMGGRGKRSSLYQWMVRHYDALSREFAQNGPQWETRVEAMGKAGLTDMAGKPPKVRTAQQTWYRVVQDKAGARRKRKPGPVAETVQPPPRQSLPTTPPPLVRVASPFDQVSAADDAEAEKHEFGFAGLKGSKKA